MSIERFNKSNIDLVLRELQAAIEAVATKHGLEVSRSRCSYQMDRVKLSCFTVSTVDVAADGTTVSAAERDFRQIAHLYSLSPDDFGRVFTDFQGRSFRIEGIKPKARKNTVIAVNVKSGKAYVWPHAAVQRHLSAS